MTKSGVFEIASERTEEERPTITVPSLELEEAIERPWREARARRACRRAAALALVLLASACANEVPSEEACPSDASPVSPEELFAAENTLVRTAASCGVPLHVLRPLTDPTDLGNRTTCVDEHGDLRDLIIVQDTNANSNLRVMRNELLLWLDECSDLS